MATWRARTLFRASLASSWRICRPKRVSDLVVAVRRVVVDVFNRTRQASSNFEPLQAPTMHGVRSCSILSLGVVSKPPRLCEPIFVPLPNATTARDISPSRPARKSNVRWLERIKRGREGLPPCRGGKNARAPPASRRRGCPLGRPADHDRIR